LLVELAAQTWQVDRRKLVTADGKVTDRDTGRSIGYGQLAKGQALAKAVAENDPLTPADEWKVAGTSLPKSDGLEFVTGKHRYTPDLKLPGMLYGKVLRPAAFGASLTSADLGPAQAMPGVVAVHDGDFVGVAAASEREAVQAIAAVRAEWKPTPQPSGRDLFRYLKQNTEQLHDTEGSPQHAAGSVEEGLAGSDHRLEQIYTVSYIAHAPLEPRAAVAEWKAGKLTVWTGTQRPFGVRGQLAEAFRIPEDRVRVIVPDTGSAYGGKHSGEAAVEAARLAQAAGRPVSLLWTREEEFTWAYFRPAGVIEVRAGVSHDGTLRAWEFHNYNSGEAGIGTPYETPNRRMEFHLARSPLRQGSYRALAATANHFARESHMDDLARAVKMDPLEFRLKNLKDARLRAAFQAAAKAFNWGRPKSSPGQGFGMGGGAEKGGYVATCAEVSVEGASRRIKVVRVVTAFECGAIVNPEHLRNQIQGANMMGLGGALFEAIEFENGRILNPHFSSYRVPRFGDMPKIEAVLIDRKDLPSSGAGETPIVGIAPAVRNAILDATGIRLHSLPMAPNGLADRA